jgi:para-nitrobenzyl esterase
MSAVAETRVGAWRGRQEGHVLVFRGLRYGEPPVGEGRLRASRPALPHAGVLDALEFGRASFQRSGFPPAIQKLAGFADLGTGEDCLFLNVTTPGVGDGRRPVLVWIHGGGFTQGSSGLFLYRAHELAARGDAVVVTINYRLGLLGAWPGREADGLDANPGLSDQMLALEWVRDHIAAFGGDPGNVTLFGQSAGAMSIGSLLAAPRAKGLFHRVILQSGAAANVHAPARREQVFEVLAKELDLDTAGDIGRQLRSLDVHLLLDAQEKVAARVQLPLGQLSWSPGFGTASLPEAPIDVVARGDVAHVPMLIGTNLDEWRMFTATDAKRRKLDESTLHAYVERTFADAPDPVARRREVLSVFETDPDTGQRRSPAEQWAALQTARVFAGPALDLADAQAAAGGDVWSYRFDWRPRLLRERLGACHSMEIPFVFGSHGHRAIWPLVGAWPGARRLSRRMQDAWLAFARGETPEHEEIREWPKHAGARPVSLRFDHEDRLDEGLGEAERAVLANEP